MELAETLFTYFFEDRDWYTFYERHLFGVRQRIRYLVAGLLLTLCLVFAHLAAL